MSQLSLMCASEEPVTAPRTGDGVSFVVYGVAQPAGSKKGFYIPKLNRVVITDDAKKSRPWKAQVSDAAAQAMQGMRLLEGPLVVELTIYLPRPKGHFGMRGLLPRAPRYPAVKPDATKLLRCFEDALSGLVYRDDAQIVTQVVRKRYGEPARCEVTLMVQQ